MHISNHACSKDSILKMEFEILKKLKFDMLTVSPLVFFKRMYFISANSPKELESYKFAKVYFCGLFFLELCLLEYKMLKYSSSVLSSATLLLSRKLNEVTPYWPKSVMNSQGFGNTTAVDECAKEMIELLKNERASTLTSLRKKFSK